MPVWNGWWGRDKTNKHNDLTKTYFNLTFFFEVNLTAVTWMHCSWLGGRDYQTVLTNTKFYPLLWTISAMFLISCSVPCFDVLFCSSFDYSSLNSSVLWHIVLGYCTDTPTGASTNFDLNKNLSMNLIWIETWNWNLKLKLKLET